MKDIPALQYEYTQTDIGLLVDLYELTMAQVYYEKGKNRTACFEVSVRSLPESWGYFLMSGLQELNEHIRKLEFGREIIEYLTSLNMFKNNFLDYLSKFTPRVRVRALPEGTLFFPDEPVLEIEGPLIEAQLLETGLLNILGFSILETTLARRIITAAKGKPVLDFGLRRAQGPVASIRAARGADLAGFAGTSNLLASSRSGFKPSGTMAHSFIQSYETEQEAFQHFIDIYNENAVLLVDTYNCHEGIRLAAEAAKKNLEKRGIRIKGIRIDSGDYIELSRYARKYFRENGVSFLKIFLSGGFDEYYINDLMKKGAEADGFGIGTNFITSFHCPALDIVYKLAEYDGKPVYKKSSGKSTLPGRKSLIRNRSESGGRYIGDCILPEGEAGDILVPFTSPKSRDQVRRRINSEIERLDPDIKKIRDPDMYPVRIDIEKELEV